MTAAVLLVVGRLVLRRRVVPTSAAPTRHLVQVLAIVAVPAALLLTARLLIGLVARMVERAAEADPPLPDRTVIAAAGRFARDASEFAIDREAAR